MKSRYLQFKGRLTPVTLAVAMIHGIASAQPAANTTSADVLDANSPFETGGQQAIGPRPFTSMLERLSSPVSKIELQVSGNNLPADGLSSTPVTVRLLNAQGIPVSGEVEVTVEVDNGARVLLDTDVPGRPSVDARE